MPSSSRVDPPGAAGGTRLNGKIPASFADVNTLRTELRHDVDHGEPAKVRAKKKKAGTIFDK
jgi:hypothetical protein